MSRDGGTAPGEGQGPPPPRPWRPGWLLGVTAAVHGAALGAALARPAWRRAAGLAVLASHVGLCLGGVAPRSRLFGPVLSRLPPTAAPDIDPSTPGPVGLSPVGLTFDDGPEPGVTDRVLDQLDAAGHRATFFAIGRRVERHPDLTAEIVRRGHRVENHTHRHPVHFSILQPPALGREIDRAQEAIASATGRYPRWLRAPAGIRNLYLEPLLARRGLHLAAWTRRGFDAADRDADRVTRRLVHGLAEGDVLLLHDGRIAGGMVRPDGREPPILEVLPRLLDELAARGLTSVPLPDPDSLVAHPEVAATSG